MVAFASSWWNDQQGDSVIGLHFVRKALSLNANNGNALDVGCGSGGRMVAALLDAGFPATGIDVSEAMLKLARKRHPDSSFIHADICEWEPRHRYDAIIAWDSIFHVPYSEQRLVVACQH